MSSTSITVTLSLIGEESVAAGAEDVDAEKAEVASVVAIEVTVAEAEAESEDVARVATAVHVVDEATLPSMSPTKTPSPVSVAHSYT